MLPILDAGMKNYAEVTAKVTDKDNQNAADAGAAGGLGFAFLNYLDGELTPRNTAYSGCCSCGRGNEGCRCGCNR